MKRILVAISDSFPYGAAYAARTRALCKLFNAAGYETDILCDYISENGETTEYGNIYCVSKNPYSGVKKLFSLPSDYTKKMEALIKEKSYDYIVARSMFDRFDKVLAVARKYKIPLILESCEWYDVRGFRHGKLDIRYHQFQHCFKRTYNKVDGVIAISRLLEEHYRSKGIPTVRIPGIHDVEKLPYRTEVLNTNKINLIFGGNVFGGKEQFSELLIALKTVNAFDKGIYLHIYGSGKEEVLMSLNEEARSVYDDLERVIMFHGRVPQIEMAVACMNSDFGVFFRPDRRSSHAGFPTKLGEYLAAGTPVITNDTGDISDVLRDGFNGFLINGVTYKQISDVFNRCINLSESNYCSMRINARKTAEKSLNYMSYIKPITMFFNSISRIGRS